jgi:hypothetical protein
MLCKMFFQQEPHNLLSHVLSQCVACLVKIAAVKVHTPRRLLEMYMSSVLLTAPQLHCESTLGVVSLRSSLYFHSSSQFWCCCKVYSWLKFNLNCWVFE